MLSFLFHSKSYLLSKSFYSGLGSILMFHRVCPSSSKPRIRGNAGLEVTPEYLENTISFLHQNNYEIVPLGQVEKILNEGPREKKFAVLTFDDGYVDNYLHAYPILKKYKIPFTIYVTTNLPDGEAILWWYLLEDLILRENRIEFEINGQGHQFSCARSWDRVPYAPRPPGSALRAGPERADAHKSTIRLRQGALGRARYRRSFILER